MSIDCTDCSVDDSEELKGFWRLQSLLPVGFEFRPTDVELVMYYLKGKINGSLRPIDLWMVPELNVYSFAPSDLPGKSAFQSCDQVWHFISPKNPNYSSDRRHSRPTQNGQWVFTGKELVIKDSTGRSPAMTLIGKKRTLIFYDERRRRRRREEDEQLPKNIWVIHEYHTTDDQDGFVLCRLLKKPVERALLQEKAICKLNDVNSSIGCVRLNNGESNN